MARNKAIDRNPRSKRVALSRSATAKLQINLTLHLACLDMMEYFRMGYATGV